MKTSSLSTLIVYLSLALATSAWRSPSHTVRQGTTPPGCRALDIDAEFPAPAVWASELPGVVPRMTGLFGPARPDYRFTALSSADVEKAVKFAADFNLRITIINTGHEYMGRNDAPSGLSLDVSHLTGVKVLPSFSPTTEGAESPDPTAPVNVITPVPGQQAAVTFGCSYPGYSVNTLISDSNISVISGASPNVCIAGGWGQMGGHGPLTSQFGLGVDQFLEFKVVTADGQLKVANNVSNPDLFWALRGGGGGNFGVVTEVTVKAHPRVPIAAHAWWINSTASPLTFFGPGNDSGGFLDAVAYLASQLPEMSEKGVSGYYYPSFDSMRAVTLMVGENATEEYARSVWDPILDEMMSFDGMKQWQSKTYIFQSYQEFFENTYINGATPGQLGLNDLMSHGLFMGLMGESPGQLLGEWVQNMYNITLPPLAENLAPRLSQRYAPDGDYDRPVPLDKVPFDSWLLDSEALKALPGLPVNSKRQLALTGLLAVSGNKAHRPDDDVAVLPAWRKAYVHVLTAHVPPLVSADWLQELSPDSGAYGNEAFWDPPNWKQTFWGSNYDRLSQIKSKYDPNNVFWSTPGINADLMEVRDGRVCTAPPNASSTDAPASDNTNFANLITNLERIRGPPESYGGFPPPNDANNS